MSKRRFKESAVVLVAVAALVVLHRRRKAAHSAEDRNGCCVEDGKSTTSTSNFKKCDMSECQPDLNSINCSGGTSTRHDPCVNGHDGENSIPSTPKGDEESRRGVPQPGQQVFALYDSFSDAEPSQPPMDLSADVILLLRSFDVDPVRGFLPPDEPLLRLPQAEFQPWEAMATALPSLLTVGKARKPLEALPVLPVDILTCPREKMRALLLLSVFAHSSVWGNPEQPQDTIPKGIAIPLSELASAEGLPPLLTHTSLVLHNWRRLDPLGPIHADNLACNFHFLGGSDETWFYTITVEIEARGGRVFGAILEAQHAIANVDFTLNGRKDASSTEESETQKNGGAIDAPHAARVVLEALKTIQAGIRDMIEALSRMPVGCHPLVFYQRVRPFLSGWRANPTLPDGVLYEGVSSSRQQYYGGSAAQSTLFPALDAALGVSHSMHCSNKFLLEMRNYMPPGHRKLLEHLAEPTCPSIRQFVESFPAELYLDPECIQRAEGTDGDDEGRGETSAANTLRDAYNGCLRALHDFRNTHLGIVSSYVLQQQKREKKAGEANSREDFAGGKGTGGTPLLDFLKPLKEDSRAGLLK